MIGEIRTRISAHVGMLTAFLSTSQYRVEQKLDALMREYQSGRMEGSVVSSLTVDSLKRDEASQWRAVRKELEEHGVTVDMFHANKGFIINWFVKAVATGAFEESQQYSKSSQSNDRLSPGTRMDNTGSMGCPRHDPERIATLYETERTSKTTAMIQSGLPEVSSLPSSASPQRPVIVPLQTNNSRDNDNVSKSKSAPNVKTATPPVLKARNTSESSTRDRKPSRLASMISLFFINSDFSYALVRKDRSTIKQWLDDSSTNIYEFLLHEAMALALKTKDKDLAESVIQRFGGMEEIIRLFMESGRYTEFKGLINLYPEFELGY